MFCDYVKAFQNMILYFPLSRNLSVKYHEPDRVSVRPCTPFIGSRSGSWYLTDKTMMSELTPFRCDSRRQRKVYDSGGSVYHDAFVWER